MILTGRDELFRYHFELEPKRTVRLIEKSFEPNMEFIRWWFKKYQKVKPFARYAYFDKNTIYDWLDGNKKTQNSEILMDRAADFISRYYKGDLRVIEATWRTRFNQGNSGR